MRHEGREDLLARGLRVESDLPGMLAVEAARLIADGAFADMDEFVLVAVATYLDMRQHSDVGDLLRLRQFQSSLNSTAVPRTFEQGRADVLARLTRPAPMTAGEAVLAIA